MDPSLYSKTPTMVARLPQDRYNELAYLMEKLANVEITREEFEHLFQDIVFPFLPHLPTEDDHVKVMLDKPKIQILTPKIELAGE